jgi:hypothetical protein
MIYRPPFTRVGLGVTAVCCLLLAGITAAEGLCRARRTRRGKAGKAALPPEDTARNPLF